MPYKGVASACQLRVFHTWVRWKRWEMSLVFVPQPTCRHSGLWSSSCFVVAAGKCAAQIPRKLTSVEKKEIRAMMRLLRPWAKKVSVGNFGGDQSWVCDNPKCVHLSCRVLYVSIQQLFQFLASLPIPFPRNFSSCSINRSSCPQALHPFVFSCYVSIHLPVANTRVCIARLHPLSEPSRFISIFHFPPLGVVGSR